MRLDWLRADVAGARRATSFLAVLLTGSIVANAMLALLIARFADRERVVLVPPTIHKTFWVNEERASGEYLEQMAYFLMQLTLNVTPQNVDYQARVLMQYAAPAAFGELRAAMLATGERLKRDENLRYIRKAWKKSSGYHIRSLAETTMFRLKTIFGDRLSTRSLETQTTQALVRCAALNKMTHLSMPQSYKLA